MTEQNRSVHLLLVCVFYFHVAIHCVSTAELFVAAISPQSLFCVWPLAQYRQVKRGSLGALTMSQLMKRQLEHQSSAPHNISTWETGQPLKYSLWRSSVRKLDSSSSSVGPTKTSLLSAPSTVSMFVPAPEEFIDEQPTTMSDRYTAWSTAQQVCSEQRLIVSI